MSRNILGCLNDIHKALAEENSAIEMKMGKTHMVWKKCMSIKFFMESSAIHRLGGYNSLIF